jgi:hypothetical protein
VVLFLVTHSESLISKELTLRLVVVLTVITPLRLVGSESSNLREFLMVLSVYTMLLKREQFKSSMKSMISYINSLKLGGLTKLKSYTQPIVSSTTIRSFPLRQRSKTCKS